MNPNLMMLIMRLLMQQLGGGAFSGKTTGPYANPFGGPRQEDDGPITVDAQVDDAPSRWYASTVPQSSHALEGEAVSRYPRVYEVLVGLVVCGLCLALFHAQLTYENCVGCVLMGVLGFCAVYDARVRSIPLATLPLVLLLGAAMRVLHLLAGNIASLTLVPIALGVIATAICTLAALVLNYKFEACRLTIGKRDLALLLCLATSTGWLGAAAFVLSVLVGLAWQKAKGGNTFPLTVPWVILILCAWATIGFPGLSF